MVGFGMLRLSGIRGLVPVCFFFSSRRRHTRLQGDWSSDVCSSDLVAAPAFNQFGGNVPSGFQLTMSAPAGTIYYSRDGSDPRLYGGAVSPAALTYKIGRASCRGRGEISVGGGSLKKKKERCYSASL